MSFPVVAKKVVKLDTIKNLKNCESSKYDTFSLLTTTQIVF